MVLLVALAAAACASRSAGNAPPAPSQPFPDRALSGHSIPIWPLNTLRADTSLGWDPALTPRRQALEKADSIIAAAMTTRRPMIKWVLPGELRRTAKKAPGMLADPDYMATELLQTRALANVPEPLRAQLRGLTGAATGGRYALVPAALRFVRDKSGRGRADLAVALVDVRGGAVSWGATGSGVADTPWEAVDRACQALTVTAPPPR